MTGYGKAVVAYKEKKINVEVKSLNSKSLDLSARIAPLYREKEMEIRRLLAQKLERGKVDFSLWVEKESTVDATPINAALIENYYKQIKAISASTGIPEPEDWFTTLLRLPDVTAKTEVEVLDDEEWEVAQQAINEAIEKLTEFRKQEGAALQKKFTEKIGTFNPNTNPATVDLNFDAALAWVLRDERMTSVIVGASSVKQLNDNLHALENLAFLNDELAEIEGILRS